MGDRLSRIAVSAVGFSLIPEGFFPHMKMEELNESYRDVGAIYCACYRQVFGEDPVGYVGTFDEKVFKLADVCQVSVPMFILINMFGHSQAYPDTTFAPGMLVDNRAANRVRVYAEACREKFGSVSAGHLDTAMGGDLVVYDLENRMRESEILAGRWIIDYKLHHPGVPYEMLFNELENELDPAWLATEQHYKTFIDDYSTRKRNPVDKESQATRHAALEIYKRMKKHKHEAISNFRSRERVMPDAAKTVLSKYGYSPGDFEIGNRPVTDPLNLWYRLGSAIQHMECLLFVNYHEGLYA
jgi:hypothetical protein